MSQTENQRRLTVRDDVPNRLDGNGQTLAHTPCRVWEWSYRAAPDSGGGTYGLRVWAANPSSGDGQAELWGLLLL